MSVSPLLSIGSRAMTANQAVLSTISNNIANASTPGYSRQQTVLATAIGQSTGSGFFGRGVDVTTVIRNHNAFLTSEAQRSGSLAAADESRSNQLTQLETVFGTGESGIGNAATQMLNAFVDVANLPQDSSARQVVLARAEEVQNRFNNAADQMASIQTGVTQDVKTAVAAVNSLARQIASVNKQIGLVDGNGDTPNDLLDQRDQLISQIGKYIQVSVVPAENGQVGLFVAGGQNLVLGAKATDLKTMTDPYDSTKVQLAIYSGGAGGVDVPIPSDSLAGGSISGLLRFQNHDLNDAQNLLGQMATAIAGAVNKQQALGLDLKNPAGNGAPIFSVGAPQALPAATNARTGNAYTSSVTVTVNDASQLQASDYELKPDPNNAGKYLLKRQADGLERSISSGDQVDGMTITVPNPAPAVGDKFLLRPVGTATGTLKRVLDDPSGIAAASPVQATMPPGNAGTATVDSLRAVNGSIDPNLKVTVTFSSDTGNYNYTTLDTTTNLPGASGSGVWSAGQPISVNGFELRLSGVPKNGDSVEVAKTQGTAANNGNALAMVALRDQSLIGKVSSGGTLAGGDSITDAYASALADIGVRVQTAKSTATTSAAVASHAETTRAGDAGVNLDEEAARLIQFQQSYQAAAKVLSVAQTIFDSLLQAANS